MTTSSDNINAIFGMVLLVAFAAVLSTVLTLWITGDSPGRDRYPGKWVKTFPDSIHSQNYDMRDLQDIFHLHLTTTGRGSSSSGSDGESNNGARLFLVKQSDPYNTSLIEVLDYNTTTDMTTATATSSRSNPNHLRNIGENPWRKTSELQTGKDIQQRSIRFMVPNSNGSRLAISDAESVSVYQQSSNSNNNNDTTTTTTTTTTTRWYQVGQTLTKETLSDWIDPTQVYALGYHAMAISEEGNRLSIAARASYDLFTQNKSLLAENSHYIIATFFLEPKNSRWKLDKVQFNFVNLFLMEAAPVFAQSGNAVAFPRYQPSENQDEPFNMVVDIYVYKYYEPTTNNASSTQEENWVKRDTLIEPKSPTENPPPMTNLGMSPHYTSLSYNGDVCAIGAPNFQQARRQYGRVQVYATTSSGSDSDSGTGSGSKNNDEKYGYPQMGQAFKAGDGVYLLGSAVSLSRDGNRLALYYTRDGLGRIQAYQYNQEQNKWLPLGNEINDAHPIRVRANHLSFTGSRIVVAWYCDNHTYRGFCFAIYELQQ